VPGTKKNDIRSTENEKNNRICNSIFYQRDELRATGSGDDTTVYIDRGSITNRGGHDNAGIFRQIKRDRSGNDNQHGKLAAENGSDEMGTERLVKQREEVKIKRRLQR
jgi:hypothetical protein